jgi:hypothetical protein
MRKYFYLATPYWHKEETIRNAREKAATVITAHLMNTGIHVFSPIVHFAAISRYWKRTWTQDELLDMDLPILANAHGLIVAELPGYSTSKGTKTEMSAAEELKLPIFHMLPYELQGIVPTATWTECDG